MSPTVRYKLVASSQGPEEFQEVQRRRPVWAGQDSEFDEARHIWVYVGGERDKFQKPHPRDEGRQSLEVRPYKNGKTVGVSTKTPYLEKKSLRSSATTPYKGGKGIEFQKPRPVWAR